MNAPRTSVLSVGNVLMGDDAFGPTVVETLLARYDLPETVKVLDLGTPGFDLHPHLAEPDEIILVDVVKASAPSGELLTYDMEAVRKYPPGPRVSPHDPGLKEALMALEFEGNLPEHFLLVATTPGGTPLEVGLSQGVSSAVDPAVERIVEELRARGHEVTKKDTPTEPDLWWLPGAPSLAQARGF